MKNLAISIYCLISLSLSSINYCFSKESCKGFSSFENNYTVKPTYKKSALLNIVTKGAIANDSTFDNSKIINQCIREADNMNMTIFIPEGNFYVSKPLFLSNCRITGIKGKSKIIIASDFTFSNQKMPTGQDVSCISNRNFSREFNVTTANSIYLSNLCFELNLKGTAGHEIKLFALANVSSGIITNCLFKTNEHLGINSSCVDLFAAVKNVRFSKCDIYSLNQSLIGGGMWVRNWAITRGGIYDEQNNTENITIDSCSFKHASKDEALAIFGSTGKVKNISVTNTDFLSAPSQIIHNVLVTVFPIQNKDRPFAAVNNVTFDKCTFTDSNFKFYVFRSGSYDDKECGNVTVKNSKFEVTKNFVSTKQGRTYNAYIAKNLNSVGGKNVFINNTIISSGVEVAIDGFDNVSNCLIKGKFLKTTNNCVLEVNNKITSSLQ